MLKSKISIIVADDHPIMLKGTQQELEHAGYNVVAVAINGASAMEVIMEHQPDVAILDIEMPLLNGFEIIKHLKKEELKTRFILMSYHKEKGFMVQAKNIGVNGYILKEDSFAEIELCISEVMKDNTYYSKSFNDDFDLVTETELKKILLLTPSERTILRLIANGNNSTQIGEALCISPRTVQKHRSNIITKLDIDSDTNALIQWAHNYKEIILTL